jgi:hypothetical protein
MKLSELLLNRFLYRDSAQNLETKDSVYESANVIQPDVPAVPAGGSAQDINTGNVQVDGSQLIPGSIPPETLDVSNWGWGQTCSFSSASATQVNWGAGTFKSANGITYTISAGNTGTMSSKTYIYLDLNVSSTTYQTTTTSATSVGVGKVLIAVAENGAVTATYNINQANQIVGDNILANSINASKIVSGSITATQIAASTITATQIAAGTITADRMNVSQLSAISANIGSITSGTITGVLFRTATTGQRIEMDTTNTNQIRFYDSSTLFGQLEVYKVGSDGYIGLIAQDDGAGFEVYTGVGASSFSSGEVFSSGGSFMTSGNASNGFNTITGKYGGYFEVFGDGSAVDRIGTDLELEADWIPSADNSYNLGSSSKKWSTVYAYTVSGLTTLTVKGTISITGSSALNRNSISQPIMYVGYVSGTTLSKSNVSWTVTNPSTGNYTITHSFGGTNYTVQVTALRASGAGAYSAKVSDLSSNSFSVIIFDDTGAAQKSDFMFALFKN